MAKRTNWKAEAKSWMDESAAAHKAQDEALSLVEKLGQQALALGRRCQNQEATIGAIFGDWKASIDRQLMAERLAAGLLANPDLVWPPTAESRALLAREALAMADALIAAAKEGSDAGH